MRTYLRNTSAVVQTLGACGGPMLWRAQHSLFQGAGRLVRSLFRESVRSLVVFVSCMTPYPLEHYWRCPPRQESNERTNEVAVCAGIVGLVGTVNDSNKV